jgi:hypothetical protein
MFRDFVLRQFYLAKSPLGEFPQSRLKKDRRARHGPNGTTINGTAPLFVKQAGPLSELLANLHAPFLYPGNFLPEITLA